MYLFALLGATVAFGFVSRRRYLSSISDVPGPFLASFSVVWQLWRIIKGDIDRECSKLHEKHGQCGTVALVEIVLKFQGPFVRISHEEVSLCHPDAIRQILLNPLHKVREHPTFRFPHGRMKPGETNRDVVELVQCYRTAGSTLPDANVYTRPQNACTKVEESGRWLCNVPCNQI